jgi:hypothetical protein
MKALARDTELGDLVSYGGSEFQVIGTRKNEERVAIRLANYFEKKDITLNPNEEVIISKKKYEISKKKGEKK